MSIPSSESWLATRPHSECVSFQLFANQLLTSHISLMKWISAPVEKRALNFSHLWRILIHSVIPASCAFGEEIRSRKRGGGWRGWYNFQAWRLFFFHTRDTWCLKGPDCIFHLLRWQHTFINFSSNTHTHTSISDHTYVGVLVFISTVTRDTTVTFFFSFLDTLLRLLALFLSVWLWILEFELHNETFISLPFVFTSLLLLLSCVHISAFHFPSWPFGFIFLPLLSLLGHFASYFFLHINSLFIWFHIFACLHSCLSF